MMEERKKPPNNRDKKKGKKNMHRKGHFGKHKENNFSHKEKTWNKDGNKGKAPHDSRQGIKGKHLIVNMPQSMLIRSSPLPLFPST
jgi:hypothetical protein